MIHNCPGCKAVLEEYKKIHENIVYCIATNQSPFYSGLTTEFGSYNCKYCNANVVEIINDPEKQSCELSN